MTTSRDGKDHDSPQEDALPPDLQRALDYLDWKLPLTDEDIRHAEARLAADPPQLPPRLLQAETAFALHQTEELKEADRDIPAPIEDRAQPNIEELDRRREREERRDDRDR